MTRLFVIVISRVVVVSKPTAYSSSNTLAEISARVLFYYVSIYVVARFYYYLRSARSRRRR